MPLFTYTANYEKDVLAKRAYHTILMKTNPVMEFAIYQSVKFANSAPVALIGGILRFGTYNMVILSLFDGMSCGQIALRELGATI